MVKYYISHNGKQSGPLSFDEVVRCLESQKLFWTDYLFDEDKKDWILLAHHPLFAELFRQPFLQETSASQVVPFPQVKTGKEWFVLKGENKYGPFAYLELIRMLQDKNLYEYDYIWTPSLSGWRRVAECEDFKPEQIRSLISAGLPQVDEAFFRRRHARVKYGTTVIVHNDKVVWKGQTVEISSGGASVIINHHELEPGHTVFLHFKAGDEVPPFNAVCSIVNKQHVDSTVKNVKYGVKFVNINREVQHAIKLFAEKVAA
jgi:hypothetical protein